MILYTRENIEEAFKSGKRKGASEITGTSIAFENFKEFIERIEPITIDEEIYETVSRKMEARRISRLMSLTPPIIVSAVSRTTHGVLGELGVTYQQIIEPSSKGKPRQKDHITMPRNVSYYLCYLHTAFGYKKLGAFFGNRNHATVISGVKTIHGWRGVEPIVSRLLDNTYDLLDDQGYDIRPNEFRVRLLNNK